MESYKSSRQTDMAAGESDFESEAESNSSHEANIGELTDLEQIKKDDKAKESRREERPLVLEERHSLSIAETKKRRANVYSKDNLFIPKELARGEVYLRQSQCLDQISKNRDYCMRMLKFPVGTGRARYVAQQMKKKKSKKLNGVKKKLPHERTSKEKCKLSVDIGNEELYMKQEPIESPERGKFDDMTQVLSTPSLNLEHTNRNQMHSDEEDCIVLEEMLNSSWSDSKEDGTEEFIEVVSNRQLSQAASLELKPKSEDELLVDKQEPLKIPLVRWHNPNGNEEDIKMGVVEEVDHMSLSANVGINGVTTAAAVHIELREEQLNGKFKHSTDVYVDQYQILGTFKQQQVEHTEDTEVQQQFNESTEDQQSEELEESPQQQLPAESMQYIPNRNYAMSAEHATTSSYTPIEAPHMTSGIILPTLYPANQLQSTSVNNNNLLSNENMQQQFIETPDYMHHWNKDSFDKCNYTRPAAQQRLSHNWQQQQQQPLHDWQQQQQQQQTYYQEKHLKTSQKELSQLNAQYKKLKCHEDKQLKEFSKALKEIHANRLTCEREHAEYHRKYMIKMMESKQQEESIQAHKNEIKKQLDDELNSLKERIANKQRQLNEDTWSISPGSQLNEQRRIIPAPSPVAYMQPPVAARSNECQSYSDGILPQRHTLGRCNTPHPLRATSNGLVNPCGTNYPSFASATTTSNVMATGHYVTLPETRTPGGQLNPGIEQTAITPIMGNYVSNYSTN
ncbi:putative uncharacterized protein DDB_G0271606 [Drosophila navojoa]|uniref:putative uncharacterized protein DDB_G0271606 n=1 Tax=Drosophila navojoa TaxID=7232 RepID=UPI0011BDAB36|nr:putative uncharacterized protein DDB_G0271606 [Drosophila navojoa]